MNRREEYLIALASMTNDERKDIVKRRVDLLLPDGFKLKDFPHGTAIRNSQLGQNGAIVSPEFCFTLTKSAGICVIVEE